MSLSSPDLDPSVVQRLLPASGLEALLSSPAPRTATIVFGSSSRIIGPIIAVPLLTLLDTMVGHTRLADEVMHDCSRKRPQQADAGLLSIIEADDHQMARRRFLESTPKAAGRFLFSIHAWPYQTPDGLHTAIGEIMDTHGGLHGSTDFAEKLRESRST